MIQNRISFTPQSEALYSRLTGHVPGSPPSQPDVNDQASRLADLVTDLWEGKPQAQELVSPFWARSVREGKTIDWEIPREQAARLTPESREVLQEANVVLRPEGYSEMPRTQHQKSIIIDDQTWFLSDPKG